MNREIAFDIAIEIIGGSIALSLIVLGSLSFLWW